MHFNMFLRNDGQAGGVGGVKNSISANWIE